MNSRLASPPDTRPDADVLIVGAGPAGMILAHELLRRGVRCRMVERREGPAGSTRAFTVHSRSMEMFDHMGLASRISELREICPGNRFHFSGMHAAEGQSTALDFRRLPATQYNYYGKVNQNDLDQALRQALAAQYDFHPEYGVEFISCEQGGSLVRARLQRSAKTSDGDEFLSVSWLVGADGARSTVRSGLGLSFEQTEGTSMTMSMVDVELSGFQGDRSWVNYFVGDNGFMLVTGLPGGKYRLYLAGEMEKLLASGTAQEAFQKGLDHFDTGAVITKMAWSSSWEIRKIVGDVYRKDRILLCGDATHVHSPAGGQGMNACMQDAFNLGWKLALVVKEKGAPGILDSYREERRPIAKQVTEGADRMHQILFNASIPVAQRFRLTQDPEWHDEAILRISGLSHNYRGIDGVVADIELTEGAVLPGERAPDCVLSDKAPRLRLYDALRHPGFTLLIVTPEKGLGDANEAELANWTATLHASYGTLVKPVLVAPHAIVGFDYDHLLVDPDGVVRRTFGGNGGQLILIRPDLYVGLRASLNARSAVDDYMRRWTMV